MVRIGLISDTHGFLDERVSHHFKNCNEIWHAGDIGGLSVIDQLSRIAPVRAVYGNIDDHSVRAEFPEDLRFDIEGVQILMTHIGGRPPRYNKRVREILQVNTPNAFICGHSHILCVKYDQALECLYLNPGAAGIHGFHKVRTLIRFAIDGTEFKNMEVIELGPRSRN